MVGRHALEFVHPEDQPRLLNAINDMRTGTPEVTETYRYQRPDGAWIWIETRARVRDGDGSRADYVAVLRDVTERKVAEFKLQEALEAMARMAATDGLTGLANRRHFDEAVERVWRRCARDRTPLSVLLLDADRFKLFNDRYGHLAGDDCLRAIAFQLDAVARGSGDLAARYGGEEFVLLMPHRNQNEAAQVADKLGKLIRNLNILHEANDPEGIVTASIGAATTWPGHPANSFGSVDGLMLAADTALYQAKRGGRNQAVVVAYEQAMSVQSWTP
jgi:diguanylate cyclase (GGDEF)-like protein